MSNEQIFGWSDLKIISVTLPSIMGAPVTAHYKTPTRDAVACCIASLVEVAVTQYLGWQPMAEESQHVVLYKEVGKPDKMEVFFQKDCCGIIYANMYDNYFTLIPAGHDA